MIWVSFKLEKVRICSDVNLLGLRVGWLVQGPGSNRSAGDLRLESDCIGVL